MTWFFLCPGADKFGKCPQSAYGAVSASTPAPILPGRRMVVSPAGGGCSQARLAGVWAVSLGAVVTRGGSVGTSGLMIAGPISCASGLNVCYVR